VVLTWERGVGERNGAIRNGMRLLCACARARLGCQALKKPNPVLPSPPLSLKLRVCTVSDKQANVWRNRRRRLFYIGVLLLLCLRTAAVEMKDDSTLLSVDYCSPPSSKCRPTFAPLRLPLLLCIPASCPWIQGCLILLAALKHVEPLSPSPPL